MNGLFLRMVLSEKVFVKRSSTSDTEMKKLSVVTQRLVPNRGDSKCITT